MTFTRFAKVVAEVRYKPGWTIDVQEKPGGIARVHVQGLVQHSKYKGPWTIDFYGEFLTRPCRTPRVVLERVKTVIFEAEDHEFAEFFRYKGKRLYDPHT